jgi:2-polyprenyl-3-methyl-5-hydroxy-6-metoxy-1,4-benzoquinol methylase
MTTRKTYEKFAVNPDGSLTLSDHTARKCDVAVKLLRKLNASQPDKRIVVLDVGCAEGALAACVVDSVTFTDVTALNPNEDESVIARELAASRPRLTVVTQTVQSYADTTFDVTLWFAVAHHLLRHSPPADVSALMAKMTRTCALVEVPVGTDVLLADLISKCPGHTHYKVLESTETVVAWLSSDFAQVRHLGRIAYDNSPTLFRHMFLCYREAPAS